jgi:glycosyltransferase involved in cell wall biosynthesis
VDLSIVVCTHNRARLLRAALSHLTTLSVDNLRLEIIVVDNNSTDDTAEVVREAARTSAAEIRYCFEAAQGISHARNRGWALARAPIVAFTDDDVYVQRDWAERVAAAFAAHGDADCVGGKVLPQWPSEPPAWLTRSHWAPLAILDYGDEPLWLDHLDSRCLIGANFAFRRDVITRIGGFAPAVQRVKDGIGSIEDHEFLIRLWNAGGRALYQPQIIAVSPVDAQRLTKRYHRLWHQGHGHFYAVMRTPEMEQSSAGRLFDVPAHLYRRCFEDSLKWGACIVGGRRDDAFACEARIRFFLGFFRTRSREYLSKKRHALPPRRFRRREATGAS